MNLIGKVLLILVIPTVLGTAILYLLNKFGLETNALSMPFALTNLFIILIQCTMLTVLSFKIFKRSVYLYLFVFSLYLFFSGVYFDLMHWPFNIIMRGVGLLGGAILGVINWRRKKDGKTYGTP